MDAERPPEEDHEQKDHEQAEERAAISATVVHEAILREGEDELKRPTSALIWSALAAGLSMGFSLVTEGLLQSMLPDAPWRPLLTKFGYSMGFLIVILGRQQLFTENTLTVILPLLQSRSMGYLKNVARLWIIVLVANLVGAFIFAWVLGGTDVFDPNMRATFAEMGHRALSGNFGTMVLRGIFAGWLIALMVWLLPFAGEMRILVIILLTFLIGLGHFPHVIAGSVEVLYLVVISAASWKDFFLGFMLPALIGNVLGGVMLVAMLNHAQVVAGAGQDV